MTCSPKTSSTACSRPPQRSASRRKHSKLLVAGRFSFHPGGDWFLAAATTEDSHRGIHGVVQRVDAESGQLLGDPLRTTKPAGIVTVSPDGKLYAVVSREAVSDGPLAATISVHHAEGDQTVVSSDHLGMTVSRKPILLSKRSAPLPQAGKRHNRKLHLTSCEGRYKWHPRRDALRSVSLRQQVRLRIVRLPRPLAGYGRR